MMRNKKRIERLEEEFANFEKTYYEIKKSKRLLENKIEILEKNTKALFGEYVIGENNLVCPVCGDEVHIVIDDMYKAFEDFLDGDKVYLVNDDRHKKSVIDLFKNIYMQDNGTFVYKIKCKNHCVGVRDENILSAINKFKSLKVGDEDEEAGTTL